MTFTYANDAAMGNSRFERREADFYATPEWCTEAVIPFLFDEPIGLYPTQRIWEPACGDGKMSRVLERYFKSVLSTDLHDRGYGQAGRDFLRCSVLPERFKAIITNPPYDLAEPFIRHALNFMMGERGVVAMFLRHEYDCAKSRNDLFHSGRHFALKVALTSRPRWIEGSEGSPRHNYAWYIWQMGYEGAPRLAYAHKPKGAAE